EAHHVAFAPTIAFEDQLAQFLVHEIEPVDRARMHGDGPRLTARARRAFDTSICDAAARQLHRQHAPGCASTDDEHGDFGDVRHRRLEIPLLAAEGWLRHKYKWIRSETARPGWSVRRNCSGLKISPS